MAYRPLAGTAGVSGLLVLGTGAASSNSSGAVHRLRHHGSAVWNYHRDHRPHAPLTPGPTVARSFAAGLLRPRWLYHHVTVNANGGGGVSSCSPRGTGLSHSGGRLTSLQAALRTLEPGGDMLLQTANSGLSGQRHHRDELGTVLTAATAPSTSAQAGPPQPRRTSTSAWALATAAQAGGNY
jgi:hypothetical protein